MRALALVLIISPALARDAEPPAAGLSPLLPVATTFPEGVDSVSVGVLDTATGRRVWERTVDRKCSRIATLSAFGTGLQLGIEERENDPGVTLGFDLKSGEKRFEQAGCVIAYLQVNGRPTVVISHPTGMTGVDVETGRRLWSWTGGGGRDLGRHRLVSYLDRPEQHIAVIDGATGAELWRRPKPEGEILVDAPGHLWMLKPKELVRLDPDTGREGPSFALPERPQRAASDGRRVYLHLARSVLALDGETLRPSWSWECPNRIDLLSAMSDHVLVTGEEYRSIHLLDPASGDRVGTLETPGLPSFGGSGQWMTRRHLLIHYVFKTGSTPEYRIADGRGTLRWQGVADGVLEIGAGRSILGWDPLRIWRRDLSRPDELWTRTLPEPISDVEIHGERVLAVSGTRIVALDADRGRDLWTWNGPSTHKAVVLGSWRRP